MWSLGLLSIVLLLPTTECAPAITTIKPNGLILSGGVSLTVQGSGLTDQTQPKIVVTGTYVENSTTLVQEFNGPSCTSVSAASLICPSPKITLTPFINAGYTVNSDIKVRLLNDARLSFKIGVSWNGYTALVNTLAVNVYKDPAFTMENPTRTYTVWTNRIVNIYGNAIDKYVIDISQYVISVSNLKCAIIVMDATFIRCLLPTTSPVPDATDKKNSLVAIRVGDFIQQLGRIWYRIPTFFDNTAGTPEIFIPSDTTSTISIKGTNFMVAITQGDIYRIQIGQGECTNIQLSPTLIKCRPPVLLPATLPMYAQKGNMSQIVITVPRIASTAAHQYTQHVGYMQYSNKIVSNNVNPGNSGNTNSTVNPNNLSDFWDAEWKWVLLGIAFFLGVVFFILTICCFCCYYQGLSRNRQAWDKRNTSAHSSFRSYRNDSRNSSFRSYRNDPGHSSFRSYLSAAGNSSFRSNKGERNNSARSSFNTYKTRMTKNSYMTDDGHYVTEEKLPNNQKY